MILLAIAPATKQALITGEIEKLPEHCLLTAQGDFRVFCVDSEQIPLSLPEIGRLREISFRAVGEGTGKERDLDDFDNYYKQLVIWDQATKRIVGGYRMGEISKLLESKGLEGLYISSLFSIDPEFNPVLAQSLELGRSFIIPEYQKKRLPLFMLWKGILFYLLTNSVYRYLIGPVSISKFYSGISKSVIVEFVSSYYFLPEFAQYVKPRTPFKPELRKVDLKRILKDLGDDVEKLDNFIEQIEPNHFRLPVLLKQYVRQNARFIGFNLDPNFNDALDGLMLLDVRQARQDTIENLKRSW